MKHAMIIPLIGGMCLAQDIVLESRPEYILTYTGFQENESHLLNWYKKTKNFEVPYYYVDDPKTYSVSGVDIIGCTAPCAGLSQLSHGFGTHNQNNQWMIKSTEYVLGTLKPEVFWGENAPGFAGSIGKDIREQMFAIAKSNGYSMSIYRTKSLLHGTPQVRSRSFYFFWKNGKVPVMNRFERPYQKIEDLLRGVKSNFQAEPINKKTPSQDPYYRYILEKMFGGISHREFSNQKLDFVGSRTCDVFSFIERNSGAANENPYKEVGEFMKELGLDNEVKKCEYRFNKLDTDKNIMRRGTIIPKDHIGAFVGHYPTTLTHPDEDRYITYREAMTIMGLPDDFELLNPTKNSNHICQNVPVKTATDMISEIVAVLNGERQLVDKDYCVQYNFNGQIEYSKQEKSKNLEGFFN